MRRFLLVTLLLISKLAMGADPTLYSSSVNWNDVASRSHLLETANVPVWDKSAITTAFEIYLHPAPREISTNNSEQKINTTFLDAYWGPISNPFVKYARPAKVFVYVDEKTAYMVPIIKNAADNNYYIFNHASKKPELLDDWISEIKTKQSASSPLKFNVCNGYGNLPTDTCKGKSYQNEESYALNTFTVNDNKQFGVGKSNLSAQRDPNKDWHQYVTNFNTLFGAADKSGTILNSSVNWGNEAERNKLLSRVVGWTDYKIIRSNFEKLRDLRYFNDKQVNGFMRRVSWLYPDDGCWTRASAVINHLFGAEGNSVNQFARPSKIFAFGNLCAKTSNHPEGRVNWWYHTAPIIRDAATNQTYVLDPSINPYKPLTTEEWMAVISANSGPCNNSMRKHTVDKFNICTGYGANPGDTCMSNANTFAGEANDALRQNTYQTYERGRQIELGRDADAVLGDQAPWMGN